MNNKIDIFESAKEKVVPQWAKFVNAGDSYQGTYVGKILGQVDSYGNEQIIYQLLQDDGSVINIGFGLNKVVLHKDMENVNFGQIVGFRYKGKLTVPDRHKKGATVDVKDFALHQDPKIVNEAWLKENKDKMPEVVQAEAKVGSVPTPVEEAEAEADVPFLSNADKLAIIEKLAGEKLGTTAKTIKEVVMEKTGLAFIPANYDKIVEKLTVM